MVRNTLVLMNLVPNMKVGMFISILTIMDVITTFMFFHTDLEVYSVLMFSGNVIFPYFFCNFVH